MKAFVISGKVDLNKERNPLKEVDLPKPIINEDEILIKVSCCGVCHTELDQLKVGHLLRVFQWFLVTK
ncbi:hypothetical protein [Echinicola salinicaeni]|uniref:hypothetical protein n=1 Tax=Echinicola salinicaeni TaxID=2762757 RepID=UPI001E49EA05|nr:hypothetical protein [Echinicola salinicaeni]